MPAITFSRRHYRFAFRVALFFVASGLVLVFVLRKGDVVNRVNIEAPAAWIKDSLANLPIYQEDSRDFWQVIHQLPLFLRHVCLTHSLTHRNPIPQRKLTGTTTNSSKKN